MKDYKIKKGCKLCKGPVIKNWTYEYLLKYFKVEKIA